MLNVPANKDLLTQTLYAIAARTGLNLESERLSPTLHHVSSNTVGGVQDGQPQVIDLELRIDLRTHESLRQAAAHVREIAERLEAAAEAKLAA